MLSAFAPLLVPVLLIGALFLDHAADYHGVCGPYAMDIPEHPCPRHEYLVNFFGGFSGLALTMIAIAAFGGTLALVVVGWVLALVVRAVRRPRRGAGEPGA